MFSRFCITSAVDESLLTPLCDYFVVSLECMLVLLIPDVPDGFTFKTVALCSSVAVYLYCCLLFLLYPCNQGPLH